MKVNSLDERKLTEVKENQKMALKAL